MPELDFDTFRRRALAAGVDEALERCWPPDAVVGTHSHDFDADAVLSAGEMWLSAGGQTRHLRPGDAFTLPRGTPHDERYAPIGATHWVARRRG